jgi:hypothetical protein
MVAAGNKSCVYCSFCVVYPLLLPTTQTSYFQVSSLLTHEVGHHTAVLGFWLSHCTMCTEQQLAAMSLYFMQLYTCVHSYRRAYTD